MTQIILTMIRTLTSEAPLKSYLVKKMKRTNNKLISLFLALVLILPFAAIRTTAANGLTAAQEKFLADMGDIASKAMKSSRVLASVTIAQAIWESGWGQSSLTKKTNNYFGFTVGSSWTGTIYCSKNDSFYSSRAEAIAILGSTKYNYWASGGDNGVPGFWRVYSSMEESVLDHNEQLATSSYYKGIPGETDYKVVCNILNKYYCNDDSYAKSIISTIEKYELFKYDSSMVSSETVTNLILDVSSLVLSVGESHALKASVYPSTATDKTVTYQTSDSNVATVSAAGVIRTVGTGMAVITAKTANGIKAEVSVYCSKDGEITYTGTINKSVYCRASKSDSTANNRGVFGVGTTVMIHGDSDDGTWYYVSGENEAGEQVSGYIYMTCVSGVTPYVEETPVTATYKGEVTYDVYVRTKPSANSDSEKLGIISIGSSVIIYGERENDFYRASGISTTGEELTGYVYANCIKITGEFAPPSPEGPQFASDDGVNYRFATTLAMLNCRKGPGTSYELSGTFDSATTVVVFGSGISGDGIDGVWYYVKGIDQSGKAIAGYCGGDYLNIDKQVLENVNMQIDESYISGIEQKTTVKSLEELFGKYSMTVKVINANGEQMASDRFVGTGSTISVTYSGIDLFAKTAFVSGDVDGDGKILATDYIRIRRHILGITTLESPFTKAADLNGNNSIDPTDYIQVRRIILGIN